MPSKLPIAALVFAASLALPGGVRAEGPREGVNVGRTSSFAKLVPAEQVERSAEQQYQQLKQQAAQQRALAPDNNPQVRRLRAIAQKMLPLTSKWNSRASQWKWEVNLSMRQPMFRERALFIWLHQV